MMGLLIVAVIASNLSAEQEAKLREVFTEE